MRAQQAAAASRSVQRVCVCSSRTSGVQAELVAYNMNSNCWQERTDAMPNHVIYSSCGGQSNGDRNFGHIFGGALFEGHACALCRQRHSCVLMHVCEELRPEKSCDRLCGNCLVKGLLTSPQHTTAFQPQRHLTPVVTGLLGMTLLQEIQNIVSIIDADSHLPLVWTWSFQFEKRIFFQLSRSTPRKTDKNEDDDAEPQKRRASKPVRLSQASKRGRGKKDKQKQKSPASASAKDDNEDGSEDDNEDGSEDGDEPKYKYNDLDLLIKVKRHGRCIFYIIGQATGSPGGLWVVVVVWVVRRASFKINLFLYYLNLFMRV